MQIITLKNGAQEASPLVTVTMMSLRSLMENHPIAFYELVMKCRDQNHQLFGNIGTLLKSLSLIDPADGIHQSIRNVVLSAVEGDGFDMTLSSPIQF